VEVTARALAGSLLIASALVARSAAAQSPAETADPTVGKEKYRLFCASCHGASGDGQGPASKGLLPPPGDFRLGKFRYGSSDRDLFEVISDGAASKGGSGLMSGWSAVLSESDRWALVRHVRSFAKRPALP
jgi:high-affinity iron transporter